MIINWKGQSLPSEFTTLIVGNCSMDVEEIQLLESTRNFMNTDIIAIHMSLHTFNNNRMEN